LLGERGRTSSSLSSGGRISGSMGTSESMSGGSN
jgi:hypothetical protein